MPARPQLSLETSQDAGAATVTSTNPLAPSLISCWAIARDVMPRNLGTIGARMAGNAAFTASNTMFIQLVVGGGPTDYVGNMSAYYHVLASGLFSTQRLEVDVSDLFDGRDMEFIKFFAYKA